MISCSKAARVVPAAELPKDAGPGKEDEEMNNEGEEDQRAAGSDLSRSGPAAAGVEADDEFDQIFQEM